MVTASESERAFATSFVPFENSFISNTPIGPFHTTVFAFLIFSANISAVFGPISKASLSSGILSISTISVSTPASILSAITTSTGSSISTPLAFAFSINSRDKSILSSSNKDLPISIP